MQYQEEQMVLISQGQECSSGFLKAPAEDKTACATCAFAIYTVEKLPEVSEPVKAAQRKALEHEIEARRRWSIPLGEQLEDHRNFKHGDFWEYEEAKINALNLRDREIFQAARFKCELNCAASPVQLCNRLEEVK